METGSLFDVFLFLSSVLLFCGSWPGTNGIGMGFGHLLMKVEFPHAPDLWKGRHCAVPISSRTYDLVQVRMQHECVMLSFLSFSLVQFMQHRRSAPKEGDNVTATRDCGQVMAILYSRLATRLRSRAIILHTPIYYHLSPRLQPYTSNYHTYDCKTEQWSMYPYRYVELLH